MRGKYPHLGEIVEEFADHAPDSPAEGNHFGDEKKEQLVKSEKNITLFLGYFVNGIDFAPLSEKSRQNCKRVDISPREFRQYMDSMFEPGGN